MDEQDSESRDNHPAVPEISPSNRFSSKISKGSLGGWKRKSFVTAGKTWPEKEY